MGYVVVADLWTGSMIVATLRELPPPDEYFDSLALRLAPLNGGAKPIVRAVRQMPSLVPVVVPDAELPEETPPGGTRPTMPKRLDF